MDFGLAKRDAGESTRILEGQLLDNADTSYYLVAGSELSAEELGGPDSSMRETIFPVAGGRLSRDHSVMAAGRWSRRIQGDSGLAMLRLATCPARPAYPSTTNRGEGNK